MPINLEFKVERSLSVNIWGRQRSAIYRNIINHKYNIYIDHLNKIFERFWVDPDTIHAYLIACYNFRRRRRRRREPNYRIVRGKKINNNSICQSPTYIQVHMYIPTNGFCRDKYINLIILRASSIGCRRWSKSKSIYGACALNSVDTKRPTVFYSIKKYMYNISKL